MRYTATFPLNTFDEVATAYASIKPMRGQYGGKDVRPIEARRRPAHRIVKVDDSTYVLSNWHIGDPIFGHYWSRTGGKLENVATNEDLLNSAPLVWRKHQDGTETITVRNSYGAQDINHYSFLHSFLPHGLTFAMTRQGKQYVCIGKVQSYYPPAPTVFDSARVFYLPHGTTVPAYVWQDIQQDRAAGVRHMGWWNKATVGNDGLSLTFKREGEGVFTFLGGGKPETIKRYRILTDVKKTYKEKLENMFTFIVTMRPLLPITDYTYLNRMDQEVAEAMSGSAWRGRHAVVRGNVPELAREMLDPEHPLHLHLAVFFMMDGMRYGMPETIDQIKALRASYTKWMNRTCGFQTIIEEEV